MIISHFLFNIYYIFKNKKLIILNKKYGLKNLNNIILTLIFEIISKEKKINIFKDKYPLYKSNNANLSISNWENLLDNLEVIQYKGFTISRISNENHFNDVISINKYLDEINFNYRNFPKKECEMNNQINNNDNILLNKQENNNVTYSKKLVVVIL